MQSDRPIYSGPNGCWIDWVGAPLGWGWHLYIPHPTLGTPTAYYTNPSDAHTPPATGWRSHGDATGVPTLSGGQVCRPPTTITISPISGTTAEDGTTATFTVTPYPAPMHDVTVPLSSSDTGEGTVPASVTLPAGSAGSVTVTVTGVGDDVDDGDIVYTIITGDPTSADAYYNDLDAGDVTDVSVTNTDDDTKGITVSPTAGLTTTEAGGTATFTVVLNSEPTGTVTIGITSSDASEGTASPATLTFTSSDWNRPKTVTVAGVDDDIVDGDIAYTIVTAPASGSDYDGLDAADVDITNIDDEPWIVIVPTGDAGDGEFLDTTLPVADGQSPPMVGERRLVASCAVGDIISGSCRILGPKRHPTLGGYVHLYLYAVDITTVPESLVLISHWMADFSCDTWEFEFSCDTRDLRPGCYDLRLSFPDESSETLRIEVTPPR